MKKINIILLILSLAAIMYGCSEEKAETPIDPNVVNRGEAEYNITAELTDNDTNNQNFQFGVNFGGQMLENDEDYYVKWDFGDTTTGEGLKPFHSFAEKGVFSVTAYITDNTTDSFRTASIDIVSGVDPDIYDTNILAYRAEDRREFKLVASGVSASGESLKYSWNFNDGTPITLAKKQNSVDHIFAKYGETYNVVVTVDNGKGGEGSKVEASIPIVTELPDLAYLCGSGGPAFDNLGTLIGQYLNCEPKLTGGNIPDVVYSWEYYSEIKQGEYNKDNASMLVTKDGVEVTYNEAEKDLYKYFALEGVGTSNVNNPTTFTYKDGGRKFIKVEGSSQNFLKTNIKYANELLLPSNAFLDLITCSLDESTDKTGLTYKCSANGYALPKNANGDSYVAPLSAYMWSVLDKDGNTLVANVENPVTTCIKQDNSSETMTGSETAEQIQQGAYKYCTSTVTYKAAKYDVAPAYSTMVLNTDYYEVIDGQETEHLKLNQTRDFRVEAPNIKSVTYNQNKTGNPLNFEFTAALDKELNNLQDIQYHWVFGDGNISTTTTNSVSHTYQNADGQYNVTVYASSSLFERTGEGTARIQMNPSFNGTGLTIKQSDINRNIFTFSSNYVAMVDGKKVKTNYQLTITGGGYERVFQIPADNITDSGFTIESVEPTVANIKQDSNVLAVPYNIPLNVELKASSDKSSSVIYATSVVPISDLSTMDWHQQGYFYLKALKNSSQTVSNVHEFTCKYELEYPGINNTIVNEEYRDKWTLYTQGQDTNNYVNTLSVPCDTQVYIKEINNGEWIGARQVKITIDDGPYIYNYKKSTLRSRG